MKTALATSQGRMAPCFAGVDLCLVDEHADLNGAERVPTLGWHPLAWGRELMRRDAGLLLCAGIDPGTWASVQGHGIEVIPTAMGEPDRVLDAWRSGQLRPPPIWPAYPAGCRGWGGGGRGWGCRRRRFRGAGW